MASNGRPSAGAASPDGEAALARSFDYRSYHLPAISFCPGWYSLMMIIIWVVFTIALWVSLPVRSPFRPLSYEARVFCFPLWMVFTAWLFSLMYRIPRAYILTRSSVVIHNLLRGLGTMSYVRVFYDEFESVALAEGGLCCPSSERCLGTRSHYASASGRQVVLRQASVRNMCFLAATLDVTIAPREPEAFFEELTARRNAFLESGRPHSPRTMRAANAVAPEPQIAMVAQPQRAYANGAPIVAPAAEYAAPQPPHAFPGNPPPCAPPAYNSLVSSNEPVDKSGGAMHASAQQPQPQPQVVRGRMTLPPLPPAPPPPRDPPADAAGAPLASRHAPARPHDAPA